MEINILKLGFSLMTLFVVVVGGLINYEKFLPVFITQTYRYGKFSYSGQPSTFKVLQVPKRWFQHFYIFSSLFSLCALWLAIKVLYFGEDPPTIIVTLFDLVATSNRKAGVNSCAVLIALTLMCLQTWRRLYETMCVSVFSDSLMNISHYLVGFIHYAGAIVAILIESPGFTSISFEYKVGVSVWDIDWRMIVGTVLFVWAWHRQFVSANILANLRKTKQGTIANLKHGLPEGDLFEYVSSPHLLCEVLLYLALSLILWGNLTWPYVFFWVLSNQMETALLSHWWYLAEFKNYPKERRAFIPYLL